MGTNVLSLPKSPRLNICRFATPSSSRPLVPSCYSRGLRQRPDIWVLLPRPALAAHHRHALSSPYLQRNPSSSPISCGSSVCTMAAAVGPVSVSHLALFLSLLVSASARLPSSDQLISLWRGPEKGIGPVALDPTRVTQLSWHPRAFLYQGFLSDEECDHLITLAKDKLEKSMVADNESGKSVASTVRTSSGMFLMKKQDEVIAKIERRISAWTFLPEENGESIQILHYENGQKYEPHFDYFHDKVNQQLGGHRVATVLMYLSNVQRGGETVFPNAEKKEQLPKDETYSDCAKGGYAVKPKKGDALLFFSLHPDATTDTFSLHGSCPVIEGEKWSATKWIHVKSFDRPLLPLAERCEDQNKLCSAWAAAGECKKNPRYMVGSEDAVGYCRKSCRVCS